MPAASVGRAEPEAPVAGVVPAVAAGPSPIPTPPPPGAKAISFGGFLLKKKKIEMAATEIITCIILTTVILDSFGTVRHPLRFKIVVIDIQITLKQMLRDFIGIRFYRFKKSGTPNISTILFVGGVRCVYATGRIL